LCEEIKGKREECEMVGKELVVCEERLRAKEREDGRLREEVKGLRLSVTQSQSTLAHLTAQLQSLH
jgi:predicted RNase H-like nuclease (RuvC/YqgF family)